MPPTATAAALNSYRGDYPCFGVNEVVVLMGKRRYDVPCDQVNSGCHSLYAQLYGPIFKEIKLQVSPARTTVKLAPC